MESAAAGLQNCRFYREKEVVIFRIFLHRSRMGFREIVSDFMPLQVLLSEVSCRFRLRDELRGLSS